jgi:hypothetical protein
VLTLPLHPFLTDDEVARVAAVAANATAAPHDRRQDRSTRGRR